MAKDPLKVMLVFGTRPEAIKMAPVWWAMQTHPKDIQPLMAVTAQHREMLDPLLSLFDLHPDDDLDLMRPGQDLAGLTARVLTGMDGVLATRKPDWVLIQGDTTTVMATALAAFYRDIRVGHIEAGLRTQNRRAPFPEEVNRRVASVVTDIHFAPTERARAALMAEGHTTETIVVTGNTVIDTLFWMRGRLRQHSPIIATEIEPKLSGGRMILVTGHRRESFGSEMESMCQGLIQIANHVSDVHIVYPVHLNPNVQEPVYRLLGSHPRIHLLPPQPYEAFVWLMDRSVLVITDSGGVQEEAPSLGKPVLVTRNVTERPEGIAAGNAQLVGTDYHTIFNAAYKLLTDTHAYRAMSNAGNPYGDGHAAQRIVNRLLEGTNADHGK